MWLIGCLSVNLFVYTNLLNSWLITQSQSSWFWLVSKPISFWPDLYHTLDHYEWEILDNDADADAIVLYSSVE